MKTKRVRWAGWLLLLLATSCATTHAVRHVKTSGFLGDYSQLQPGGDGEPALIYRQAAAGPGYAKLLIDPVVAYAGPGSRLHKLSPEDRQALLDYFHAALREQLGQDFALAETAGPGTLRLRVALTDARGSKILLDTLSTVVPVGLAISALQRVALGQTATSGRATIEAEVLDSQTGERRVALVDGRAGRKVTGRFDKWKKWQDVRDACDYWSGSLRAELARQGVPAGSR